MCAGIRSLVLRMYVHRYIDWGFDVYNNIITLCIPGLTISSALHVYTRFWTSFVLYAIKSEYLPPSLLLWVLLLSSHAQAAASASPLKDLLVAAGKERLHEVQSLLDRGRCKVNDEDEVCTSKGIELVYEDIVLRVVCVWMCMYICFMCTCV